MCVRRALNGSIWLRIFLNIDQKQKYAHNARLYPICEKCLHECRSIYIIGDLNIHFLKNPNPLDDVLDIFSLTNVVHEPTCFKNVDNPTLIYVILTNTPRRLTNVLNVSLGISDFHNLICVATKMCKPNNITRNE